MSAAALNVTTVVPGGVLSPTNTRVLTAEFEYARPETVEAVLAELAEHGEQAQLLGGGTDLLVQLKMERTDGTRVVSLTGVPELAGIDESDGLRIGAMTRIRTIAQAPTVLERYRALADACESFSTVPVMLMATVGGNLCNASPASDTAPALIALGAEVELVSRADVRRLPVADLFTGPGATVLQSGELLRSVLIPAPPANSGSAFVKVARVGADIAKATAAVSLTRDGDKVAEAHIALGAVAPTPLAAVKAGDSLRGGTAHRDRFAEAGQIAASECSPISDVRSTEAYRRDVVATIVSDALTEAWVRSGGKELS